MDEANVETHGFEPSFTKKNAHPACWPEWHDAIVDRGVRMVSSLFPQAAAAAAATACSKHNTAVAFFADHFNAVLAHVIAHAAAVRITNVSHLLPCRPFGPTSFTGYMSEFRPVSAAPCQCPGRLALCQMP
jgi:hypothetical protein